MGCIRFAQERCLPKFSATSDRDVRYCVSKPIVRRSAGAAWQPTYGRQAAQLSLTNPSDASRQTANVLNSHVTITTPLCWRYVILLHRIHIAYSCTKFDDFRFSRCSDMIGAPTFCNGSHALTTSLSIRNSLSSVGCDLHKI